MTDEPEDIDRPGTKGMSGQKPEDRKKQPDRSGHLAWRIDDVEHHGIEPSEGSRRLKSFKTWKKNEGF